MLHERLTPLPAQLPPRPPPSARPGAAPCSGSALDRSAKPESNASAPAASPAAIVPGGQVGRLTRWVAVAVIFFLADAVQLLLLLPDRTGELFAWAIDPQVTSLVLGAAYVAGGLLLRPSRDGGRPGIGSRRGSPPSSSSSGWPLRPRPCTSTASCHDGLSFAAWAAIYSIAPLGLPLLYLAQRRDARVPRADVPMSARARMLLGCAGAPVLIVALLAFAAPQSTIDLWPWTLTPLTARIVATVMALFGSLWVSVAIHGGKTAARILLEAHALGLAFLLLAGGRGHGNIDWTNPLAVILVAASWA